MNASALFCAGVAVAVLLTTLAGSVRGQVTSNAGDGVLNAPYRGTITSLREASEDISYGEVKTHCEPFAGNTSMITSSTISIWAEGSACQVGEPCWDRSVLRLYEGADASGPELDLTGKTQDDPLIRSVSGGFHRMSLKAIGIKTLTPQVYNVKFRYARDGTFSTFSRPYTVVPFTGSFFSTPGESEAFHFGTPILGVDVGAASLVVPVGRTAEMIGATFEDKDRQLGPSTMATTDILFPGSAESVFVAQQPQFRLNESSYAKAVFGTPWPGHLIGFSNSGNTFAGDGTQFLINPSNASTEGMRPYERVRPKGVDAASVQYVYDNSFNNRVIEIRDQANPPNVITLTRFLGVVTSITTSDGRGWTIGTNPDGWISDITPTGGHGRRFFTYNSQGRVTRVSNDPNPLVPPMYEFVYANDANGNPTILTEEKRFVDNAMRTVVRHCVKLPAGSPPDPNCPTVSDTLEYRREYTGTGGEYRQFDFNYDAAYGLKHRLASMTSYENVNGGGTHFTTTYTHDINNSAGTMTVTQVGLPDGSVINHEYDAHTSGQTVKFGFRTKSARTRPDDGSLVTFEVTYEFFYSSPARLFYRPRIVQQRDGRGPVSEVTFDYENGFADENFDFCEGQDCNQLLRRTGPTITLGTSNRTPETVFTYNADRTLWRRDIDFGPDANDYRRTEFTYDPLLRLRTQTVDPTGENIETRYLYCDTDRTQDRITVDPDGYWTRTRFNNNGQVTTTERFLDANVGNPNAPNAGCTEPPGSPDVYKTTSSYNTSGFLEQQVVENKDQDGQFLIPKTITTTFSPDRLGRIELQTVDSGGIGQESNFDYNWLGEVERQFDTSSRGTKQTFDGRGLVKSEIPLAVDEVPDTNLTTTFTYNAMGNLRFTDPPTRPTGAQEERVYDEFDRLKQIIRQPGTNGGKTITTEFSYDAANNVTRTLVEEGPPTVTLSDSTAQFDEGNFNFKSRQRMAAGVDDDTKDAVTERKFDWAGNVIEEKSFGDATVAHRVITTVYDGANRIRKITDNLGGETSFERDDRGNMLDQTVKIDASNSAVTTTVYDALSRVVRITSPEDSLQKRHYRTRNYDSRNNLLRETLLDASTEPAVEKLTNVFSYDNAGRQTRQAVLANPASDILASAASVTTDRVTDSVYDADGRLEVRRTYNNYLPTPLETETTYDDLGRVDRVTDPPTGTVPATFTDVDYAANGRLSQRVVFDGVGTRTFTFGYDGHDRIKQQTAVGSPNLVTLFTLDGLDRQTGITDPKAIVTRTDFDLVGRRKTLVEDEGGALQRQTDFAYNRLSQLITQTAQNRTSTGAPLANQLTTYRYDSLGRQTRIVYPDSAQHAGPLNCTDCVRQTFDLAGRMTERVDQQAVHATTFAYDDRGLLLTRTTSTDRDTFNYDAVGRITLADRGTTVGPNQDAVSHSAMGYTDLGDLDFETQAIAEGTSRTTDYSYDQAGNRKQLTYPDGGTVLAYTSTALNQIDTVNLNAAPFLNYDYQGRLLDRRRTTTTAPGGTTIYENDVGYDSHRRVNSIANRFQPGGGNLQTVAAYGFSHDDNGNPLTQTVAEGLAGFVADDRAFTVDRLNRLTGTEYFENGQVESDTLDRVGNRESHVSRAGVTTNYTLLDPDGGGPATTANEYATIETVPGLPMPLTYDAAGNLAVDQNGRQYFYDELNRLKQVKDIGNTVLANYTYDALGRRITFNDPVAATTTRYYYDGQSAIEERDGTCPGVNCDVRLRYHVNGAQFIDERVATFTQAGQPTYYLGSSNFSVIGTGNADGTVVERLDYSSTGDFVGGGPGANAFYHDADDDLDIDLRDFANFQNCFDPTPPVLPACAPIHDFDTTDPFSDGDIDLDDYARFHDCFRGQFVTPDQTCGVPSNTAGLPISGTFTLHGRPMDILSDDHALSDFRARTYVPALGRWLQRDSLGYFDGSDLYEAFRANPLRFRDPFGRQGESEDGSFIDAVKNLYYLFATPEGMYERATETNPIKRSLYRDLELQVGASAGLAKKTEQAAAITTGVIGTAGGIAEVGAGVVLFIPSYGLSGAFIFHGADVVQANWRQTRSAEFTSTFTYQTISEAGFPTIALVVDIGVSLGSGASGFAAADDLIAVPSRLVSASTARGSRLLDLAEHGQQRLAIILFDARAGDTVLGSVASPGTISSSRGRQLMLPFIQPTPVSDRIEVILERSFAYEVARASASGQLNRAEIGTVGHVRAIRTLRRFAEHSSIELGPNGLAFEVRGPTSVPDVVFVPEQVLFDLKLTPKARRSSQIQSFKRDFPGYEIRIIYGERRLP